MTASSFSSRLAVAAAATAAALGLTAASCTVNSDTTTDVSSSEASLSSSVSSTTPPPSSSGTPSETPSTKRPLPAEPTYPERPHPYSLDVPAVCGNPPGRTEHGRYDFLGGSLSLAHTTNGDAAVAYGHMEPYTEEVFLVGYDCVIDGKKHPARFVLYSTTGAVLAYTPGDREAAGPGPVIGMGFDTNSARSVSVTLPAAGPIVPGGEIIELPWILTTMDAAPTSAVKYLVPEWVAHPGTRPSLPERLPSPIPVPTEPNTSMS